ncbi:S9 family peptidase [Allonocardiopsis opalescens]|uniref:Dipeptidyl aminopeptidase/acylaminoacyl peptidase n=1 Tax=Allonocardiopsis opalescens TaxID=1144618 RepID=A0A2T0QFE5_9ACTN|nr:prolyl oligopeptidase family serine peptidase [Allonocardiopsis opalescens]PRY02654.1 dipeptidyl aminopeptidase/acylaminoacyl peptidase [Allonocardiopsis opalescens]
MTDPVTTPYGSWPSPLSATDVAQAGRQLGYPSIVGDDVWWQESRPDHNGRITVMHRAADGTVTELLPAPWQARTRVHEYGGRSYLPVPLPRPRDGSGGRRRRGIVFANFADQRLYLLDPADGTPRPLTPEPPVQAAHRYADFVLAPDRRHLLCVTERHHTGQITRAIVAVPLSGRAAEDPAALRELVGGADFFASPRPSPDGRHLAWVTWNHPRMPWDGSELRVAEVTAEGALAHARTVKGGLTESVLAPAWRDSESLYVVSDWTGWWNIYHVGLFGQSPHALYPVEEEFSQPLWRLGNDPYAVLADGRLVVLHGHADLRPAVLDPEDAELTPLDLPYDSWLSELATDGRHVVGVGGGPATAPAVVRIDPDAGTGTPLRTGLDRLPDPAYLPRPTALKFEGRFGQTVHAHLYPPTNPRATAAGPAPYVVWVHGGPTSAAGTALDLTRAYFTSRGIGVIDVNYGGSAGYGRTYRERLRHQWGVVDVEDAQAAAHHLAATGLADPARIAIRGGSAGGWTTLAALTRTTTFAGGVSYYGVTELLAFAEETHDFESRYLEGLVGPLPGYQARYVERSPITRVDAVRAPVLLLQGTEDPVVVPGQSERFVQRLAANGVPHAYLDFEGEAHGFRRPETIVAALEAELSFYAQIFGFDTDVPPLELKHGTPAGWSLGGAPATDQDG